MKILSSMTTLLLASTLIICFPTSSISNDETVASLGNLISSVGNALSFGAALGAKALVNVTPHAGQNVTAQDSYHADINPYPIDNRFLTVNVKNPGTTQTFFIYFNFLSPDTKDLNTDEKNDNNSEGIYKLDGIVVRLPVPLRISVTTDTTAAQRAATAYQADYDLNLAKSAGKNYSVLKSVAATADQAAWDAFEAGATESQSSFALVPDLNHTCLFPFERRYLVQTSTKVTLTNGMIMSVEKNKPSLVAGIVGIPKTILSALVPIPLQIKQSQTNILQAEDNTLKAQADISKGQ